MARAPQPIELYRYRDVRVLLRAWVGAFRLQLGAARGTSALGVALGASPGQVRNMLTGRRRLGEPYLTRFVQLWELGPDEEAFLRALTAATYLPPSQREAARVALAERIPADASRRLDPGRVVALLSDLRRVEATPESALHGTWEGPLLLAWAAGGLPDLPATALARRVKDATHAGAMRRARDRLVEQGYLHKEDGQLFVSGEQSQEGIGGISPETYTRVHTRSIERARQDLYDGEADAVYTWELVGLADDTEGAITTPLVSCLMDRAATLDALQRDAVAHAEPLDTVYETWMTVLPLGRVRPG